MTAIRSGAKMRLVRGADFRGTTDASARSWYRAVLENYVKDQLRKSRRAELSASEFADCVAREESLAATASAPARIDLGECYEIWWPDLTPSEPAENARIRNRLYQLHRRGLVAVRDILQRNRKSE